MPSFATLFLLPFVFVHSIPRAPAQHFALNLLQNVRLGRDGREVAFVQLFFQSHHLIKVSMPAVSHRRPGSAIDGPSKVLAQPEPALEPFPAHVGFDRVVQPDIPGPDVCLLRRDRIVYAMAGGQIGDRDIGIFADEDVLLDVVSCKTTQLVAGRRRERPRQLWELGAAGRTVLEAHLRAFRAELGRRDVEVARHVFECLLVGEELVVVAADVAQQSCEEVFDVSKDAVAHDDDGGMVLSVTFSFLFPLGERKVVIVEYIGGGRGWLVSVPSRKSSFGYARLGTEKPIVHCFSHPRPA